MGIIFEYIENKKENFKYVIFEIIGKEGKILNIFFGMFRLKLLNCLRR